MLIRNTLTVIITVLLALPASAEVIQVDNDKLKVLMAAGVPVVDVRTREEWKTIGVVKGTHLLTFFDRNGRYDARKFLHDLRQIAAPDEPVVFICEVGGRTGVITRFLDTKAGYTKVHDVSKGIRAWINAGEPVAKAQLPH